MDLELNNLQMLICHKTNQPTNLFWEGKYGSFFFLVKITVLDAE